MTDVTKVVADALSAFETFKKDLAPKIDKLDALDTEKFNRVEKAIGDSIEVAQKESGRVAALEAQVKSLEVMLSRPEMGVKTDESKQRVTTAFNEFLKKSSSERVDFHTFLERNGKQMELKDLTVNVDQQGGYLVLPTFGGIIQTRVFESSPIRQLATVQPISSDSYEIVADYDEAGATWVGETATRSVNTTPNLGKIIIPAHEMQVNVKATQKILEDAVIDMESWLAVKTGDRMRRLEATAFVSGDGIARPRGITTYTSGTDIALAQVQRVNMGSTSAFVYDGLVDLQNSLKEEYQSNATFLMRRATFGLMMKLKTGITSDNTPVFNMTYGLNNGVPSMLVLGRPIMFADDVATVGSGSLSVIYGDFKTAYTVVDRIGMKTLRDPFTDKPFVLFYSTKRVGGAVVNFEAIKLSVFS